MNWIVYRGFNRFDAAAFYFVGFMCATESYWWTLSIIPASIISVLLETCFRKDPQP